ncbi:MAG TPA: FkbM family methyltransferase [Burkholderiales bacterium]|nr:FkbM family methyltransferase [Burkholderiales bacterium]
MTRRPADSPYQRALRAHQAGRLREAETLYRKAIEWNPRHAGATYMLAVIADQVGNYAVAARLAGDALRLGGESAVVRFFQGSVLLKTGKLSEARAALVAALRLPSADAQMLAALGASLRECGEFEMAGECWRRALRLNPVLPAAHNALGGALLERGEVAAALAEFDAALAQAPSFVEAAYNRREALRRLGRAPDPCVTARLDAAARDLRCAVITPVGPGHVDLADECARSVECAFVADPGRFAEVRHLRIDDRQGALGRSRARNEGTRQAAAEGFDYVFFLDADDTMSADAFAVVAPYLAEHDAIWGAISTFRDRPADAILRADQLWCSASLSDVLFLHPSLTLQMGHFVRTGIASHHLFDESLDAGEDFDYYLRVWDSARCLKLPRPLFHNRRGRHSVGPRSASGAQWSDAAEARIRAWFRGRTAPCSFPFEGREITFHVGNPRDSIDRHFIAGGFFEAAELRYLREHVPAGARIVEVGAHVGNHAVFLGLFTSPSSMLLVEPNPAAVALLEANLRANGLDGAAVTIRRVAAADRRGQFKLVSKEADNLGATCLTPSLDATGVEAWPLDELVEGPVNFLKIDAEGMEIEVLQGGRRLVAAHRPPMLVEVANANVERFRSYLAAMDYEIARRFEYVHASNFHVVSRR